MNKLLTKLLTLTFVFGGFTACDQPEYRAVSFEDSAGEFECYYDSEDDDVTCDLANPEGDVSGFTEYPYCSKTDADPKKHGFVIARCVYKGKWYTLHCKLDGSSCDKQ